MINNTHWQNNEIIQRRRLARCTAWIAGAIALMFYTGFMLLGILGR